jgi:transposase-like protein
MEDNKFSAKNLEWLIHQPIDMQFELFRNFIEMVRLHYAELTKQEVEEKAGKGHERGKAYSRWGSNPGSIRVGGEKIPVEVPRLYHKGEHRTESAEYYGKLREIADPSVDVIKKVIKGLSQKDYEEVTRTVVESFGLSQSSISRQFIEGSRKQLEAFEKRDLGDHDFIAIVLDGKYLSKEQVVIALGVTLTGVKIPLGFIHTTTENSRAIKGLLKELLRRNFRFTEGILAIIDGSKGLRKAIEETFGRYVLIQRCQWHKRENVASYLAERDQELYRRKIQRAYLEPDYATAKRRLGEIREELRKINHSAAASLDEGLEETLTLHRLGLIEELGQSFSTTNLIENVNSQLGKYLWKVKYWMNADMKARWIAVALLEVERKMHRIDGYKKLPLLRTAIKTELKLKQRKAA